MKDSLNNAISLDQKATSKTVSSSKNKIFFKDIDLPLIAIMASKKI